MWSQRDSRWGSKKLGNSGLYMKDFGCLVTDVAISLKLSGYDTDPGRLVDKLNSISGFTPDGSMYWGKVTQLYPKFIYGSGTWRFIQGRWGNIFHWVLKTPGGTIYEPYYNGTGYPNNFYLTGQIRYVSIGSVAPTPPPVSYQFKINLYVGMRHSDVTRLQNKLKSLGFYSKTVASTGYFGNITRDAVSKFQRAYGISPTVGYFGPATRGKINKL